MNEYEVDLQFTSHLLGDPSRVYDSDSSMIRRETSLSQEDIELAEGDRTSEVWHKKTFPFFYFYTTNLSFHPLPLSPTHPPSLLSPSPFINNSLQNPIIV